jgi:1-acyl-sn-glycerol-3-phosphate acyltransferase
MPKEMIKALWYRIACRACWLFCVLLFRCRVYDRQNVPKKGPFLLVSNHQSFLDPLFCGVFISRPLSFLARESLFSKRLFGGLISSVSAIPVKQGQADLSAMRTVISKLKQGRGVCLFPEGTRTTDGRIAPFKGGLGLLARRADAPIVPVVIDGAFECWPRHKKVFSPFKDIAVCYGKAITAEQTRQMKDKQLAELLTNTLHQMQNDCRLKQSKQPYDYNQ